MRFVRGQVAVITGAGSGFGREMALQLAGKGLHLGICDYDEVGLQITAAACRGAGVTVVAELCDVGSKEAVFGFRDKVVEKFGHVHFCAANAGVASHDIFNMFIPSSTF